MKVERLTHEEFINTSGKFYTALTCGHYIRPRIKGTYLAIVRCPKCLKKARILSDNIMSKWEDKSNK